MNVYYILFKYRLFKSNAANLTVVDWSWARAVTVSTSSVMATARLVTSVTNNESYILEMKVDAEIDVVCMDSDPLPQLRWGVTWGSLGVSTGDYSLLFYRTITAQEAAAMADELKGH